MQNGSASKIESMALGIKAPPTIPQPLHQCITNSAQWIKIRNYLFPSQQLIAFGATLQKQILISRSKKVVLPTNGRPKHTSFLSVFRSFLFVSCHPHAAKSARPTLTVYTSNDAISCKKEVPFGCPKPSKNVQGFC